MCVCMCVAVRSGFRTYVSRVRERCIKVKLMCREEEVYLKDTTSLS